MGALIGIAIIAALLAGGIFLGRSSLKPELESMAKEVSWYRSTFMRKQGASLATGEYDLRSIDGGRTWWSVVEDGGIIRSVTSAEKAFPGLLKQLAGMEALIARATARGPLSLSESLSAGDLRLLSDAGLTATGRGK